MAEGRGSLRVPDREPLGEKVRAEVGEEEC